MSPITVTSVNRNVTISSGSPANAHATYTHTQASASSIWTITHNLNCFPSVTVVDSADSVVIGDVEYISANVVRVTFMAAFAGKAYLN
jgi:hypothetical protein